MSYGGYGSDQDEDEANYKQYEIREGTCFLIELTPSMFYPIPELGNRSQILEILTSINELLSEMIITSSHNGVGIYFYNCHKTGNKFKKHSKINKMFRLNDINATCMKALSDLIEDASEDPRVLHERFPPSKTTDNINLVTVLSTMISEFQSKTNYNKKKLVWFTNNDSPYDMNAEDAQTTKLSLRSFLEDFDQFKIGIVPIFLDSYKASGSEIDHKFELKQYQDLFVNTSYLKRKRSDENDSDLDDDSDVEVKQEFPNQRLKQSTLASQIRDAILRLKEVKRIQFACNLILSDGPKSGGRFGISVKGYTLYNHERVRKSRDLYPTGDSFKVIHSSIKYVDSNDQREITVGSAGDDNNMTQSAKEDKSNIRRGYAVNRNEHGDEAIFHFGQEQMKFMKNYAFDHGSGETSDAEEVEDSLDNLDDDDEDENSYTKPPYLKLIGFRDCQRFQPFFNTSSPIFITPDLNNGMRTSSSSGGFSSSFTTFASLYQSCLKLNKVLILFGCIKKNAKPQLYVMYPTNLDSFQHIPQGFLLIRLPWLNDVRSVPEYAMAGLHTQAADGDLVGNITQLISHYFLPQGYQPREWPNPALNYYYKIIRHEILQLNLEQEDTLLVKNDATMAHLIKLQQDLYDNTDKQQLLETVQQQLTKLGNMAQLKRGYEETEVRPAKKAVEPLSEMTVLTAWKNASLEQFTVSQLRTFADKYPRDIKKAGRKQDLIDSISEYLSKKVK